MQDFQLISRQSRLDFIITRYVYNVGLLGPAVFSLISFLHHRNLEGFVVFIAGIFLAGLMLYVLFMFDAVRRQSEILSGYLKKFSKCEFVKYQIFDYFPDNPFDADPYD